MEQIQSFKFINLVPSLLQGQDTISLTFPTELPCQYEYHMYGKSGSQMRIWTQKNSDSEL